MLKFLSRHFFSPEVDTSQVAVLLVCTANYCRSPMAEGMLRQCLVSRGLSELVRVDSAGTHVARNGQSPDPRAQQTLLPFGVDIQRLRSRSIQRLDFSEYDYVLAMDKANYKSLLRLCPEALQHKLALIMTYAPQSGVTEVPDPYYSNKAGFQQVYTFLEDAIAGLVDSIEKDMA